jgi:two-component system, NarL family, response regulator DegU
MEPILDKLSVLIVDDHPLFRTAINRLLKNIPFVKRVAEAENGVSALEMMEKETYDIVLLDLMMPVMDGSETARHIRKRYPTCRIVVLTMSDSRNEIIELLGMGVLGYVLKSTDEEELTSAILRVREGTPYLSAAVENVWLDFLSERSKNEILKNNQFFDKNELSDREKEIIIMLCKQMNSKEIAEILSMSQHTVNTHRHNIMKKLDTDNVVGIAIYAIKNGIYQP